LDDRFLFFLFKKRLCSNFNALFVCLGSNKPENVKNQIRASYQALGGKRPIDLWQAHHIHGTKDTIVPNTIGAIQAAFEMVKAGLVRYVGLCNASVAQVEACLKAGLNIVSVQVRLKWVLLLFVVRVHFANTINTQNEFNLFSQQALKKPSAAVTSRHGLIQ
jgi:hypothetical protein